MKDFFVFLKSKLFLKHFLLAIISLLVVIWGLIKFLDVYTHHRETAAVPNFKGKLIAELPTFVVDKYVRYEILDSIYDPNEKPGVVIKQDPEEKTFVKRNRIIYLYVTSTQAPKIEMPKLVDRSERQAIFMIESYGLVVGTIKEIAGDCKGCVLQQLYNGKEISVGAPIKKGSKIDLNIGRREFDYSATDSISAQNDTNVE